MAVHAIDTPGAVPTKFVASGLAVPSCVSRRYHQADAWCPWLSTVISVSVQVSAWTPAFCPSMAPFIDRLR